MLIVFEVVVAAGEDPDAILSREVLEETHAQVMSVEEATAVGFSGARRDPKGREIRLIAVAPRDAKFVESRLQASAAAQSFRRHEVEV